MDFARRFDLFAQGISFNIMGHSRSKSLVGTLFSFLLMIAIILCIISFGADFFNKTNPTLLQTNVVPESYGAPFRLISKEFQFPFRMKNLMTGETIDFSKAMYPETALYKFEMINGTSKLTERIWIPTKSCTPDMMPEEAMKAMKNISQYLCFDFDKHNITIGGASEASYNYIAGLRYRCSTTPLNSFEDPETCDYDVLNNLISYYQKTQQYAFLEMYYPEIYITNEYENPMKIYYKSYNYEINMVTQLNEQFIFEKVRFIDDKGWILNYQETSEKMSQVQRTNTQTVLTREMVEIDKWSIYAFQIELNKNYRLYERSFMKIQDLAAQVGGIINFFHKLLLITHTFLFRYLQNEALINSIFSYGRNNDFKSSAEPFKSLPM